ncbi:MAG TPA: YncE family protein, partial [Vicinamibacterales bacterium]|nr:YncE family protein [Vicinamibacterales bacterium]
MKRLIWVAALCLAAAGARAAAVPNAAALRVPVTITAADRGDYTHVLPTGRQVSPVGTIAGTPNFPTAVAVAGSRIAVLSNGATRTQSLSLLGRGTLTTSARVLAYPRGVTSPPPDGDAVTVPRQDFFQGLAAGPNGMLYAAGGNADDVLAVALGGDAPRLVRRYPLAWQAFPRTEYPYRYAGPLSGEPRHFYPDAVALGPRGRHLLVGGMLANAVARIDLATGAVAYLNVGSYPNALALADRGRRLVVSLWGENAVAVVDARDFRLLGRIQLGPPNAPSASAPGIHPIALAADPASSRVFVALANVDRIAEIDAATLKRVRLIDDAPYPGAPPGSYPDALALAGGRLYAANAGNDDVAVFSVGSGTLLGAIPTGWYPTALAATPHALYVAAAKGLGAGPNVRHQWAGDMMGGLVQRIALPLSAADLARDTNRALGNDRFLAAQRTAAAAHDARLTQALRKKIRTVVLILRENKTFDQEFGGYPGLGTWADPHLAMYRRRELPNLYALAGGGALFADFDVDGEVTAQGHQWTTAASDSDFVQRTWPAYYSDRGPVQNPGWTGPQADADTAHGNVPLGFDNP